MQDSLAGRRLSDVPAVSQPNDELIAAGALPPAGAMPEVPRGAAAACKLTDAVYMFRYIAQPRGVKDAALSQGFHQAVPVVN